MIIEYIYCSKLSIFKSIRFEQLEYYRESKSDKKYRYEFRGYEFFLNFHSQYWFFKKKKKNTLSIISLSNRLVFLERNVDVTTQR